LEIPGSRWAHLRVVTVAEDYARDKRLFHCRLRAGWSLEARTMFWAALGFELLLVGFVGSLLPPLWLLLLSLPLFAWFLAREKRRLQSLLIVFLDELAKELNLIKARTDDEVGRTVKLAGD
jgi:hypothetical protein